ncbi:hypothetical protein D043_3963B, partial [Vibrio parahaemolyticus EKP-021]
NAFAQADAVDWSSIPCQ